MEGKRTIPYGVINWTTLVRECLFVDNTAYIRRLGDVRAPVFQRPKRFGKSIACSMLAHCCRGLLAFEDEMAFNIPNLMVKNMFVDYYDELSEFTNVGEARRAFVKSARAHVKADGSWRDIFEAI